MTLMYLMRHGQTLFNTMDINQGSCDSPLTELGIAQAKKAKEWFVGNQIHFDKVYTSSSERAMDTTELITDLPYTKLKGLKEIHLGTKEASPNSDNPVYPYGDYFVQFGGESLEGFTQRFYETVEMIADEANDQTVLVVSHGMAIRRFLTAIKHDGHDVILGNCGIVVLDYDNGHFQVLDVINPNL